MAKQIKANQVADVLKQLVARQAGKCGMCGLAFTKMDIPVLDHDHTSGYIRGACHRSCNGAEGRVKTKARLGHKGVLPEDFIIGLGKYLDKHSTPQVNLIHPQHMTEDAKRLARNKKARDARVRQKAK